MDEVLNITVFGESLLNDGKTTTSSNTVQYSAVVKYSALYY